MATCNSCGTFIVFGGVKEENLRFCNAGCQKNFQCAAGPEHPPGVVERWVREIHEGPCPICQGPGPVDVHQSHRVWSAIAMTRWSTRPHLCCHSCARKKQLGDTIFSLALGWWGFPWGLIFTPVQVTRNLNGAINGPDPFAPSAELQQLVQSGALRPVVLEPVSTRSI